MEDYKLPFKRVTVRAVILRREDGALLGMLHRVDGKYAPPGGGMNKGESAEEALIRELAEEQIEIVGRDPKWRERMAVDYYDRHEELNIWYIFLADDVHIGYSNEWIDARWLNQTQDVWYPGMRERIFLAIENYLPDMLKVEVSVLDSW
ncbi:MAG: NUDIX domain-containing protein [Anaerolineales bacterium]|nr:NUDIX domain-containing protein [Anaerolineales bacterium]